MNASGTASPERRPITPATEAACYATGFLSLGLVPMMLLAVPLWAISLGASPFAIGLVVGARSVLPLLFSIHGGSMMDRLGVRRVMFWLAGTCILLVPLYPLMPWIPALLVLQLVLGLAQGLTWVGAQTQIGRLTGGSAVHSGRFSFASTAGTFAGPLAAGIAWDVSGPAGAFGIIAGWCIVLWLSIYFLPDADSDGGTTPEAASWRILVPRPGDYLAAARLLAIPSVGLVVIATFARIATLSIQGSFYTVYLDSIELPGTLIGGLIAGASIVSSLAALLNGLLSARIRQSWLLIGCLALSTAAMGLTPFVTSLASLAVLAVLFGIGLGLTLPPILSILSQAAGPARQGLGVGLRTTANRLSSLVIPVGMGAVADLFGLQGAFVAVSGVLVLIFVVMGLLVRHHRL